MRGERRSICAGAEFSGFPSGRAVCLVDVIEDREISAEITRASSVRHESPQVLLLKGGRVVWHASHYGITAEAVARECLKAD